MNITQVSLLLVTIIILTLCLFFFRSADKGQKLKEAWEHQQFLHAVDDIESWIADMESQLASEDLGRDLISVNKLLKKHAVS